MPTVLIVDDDSTVVESIRNAIPSQVEVASASSAEAATAMLDEREFCGLVLDLSLADSDAFDVLRHMEARRMSVPTVVMGERMPVAMRERLAEEQVKLVFPKPVEPRLLAAIVLGFCGIG